MKYAIINRKTNECLSINSLRKLETYISEIYPEDKLSHSTISKRFKETFPNISNVSIFNYYDLVIIQYEIG